MPESPARIPGWIRLYQPGKASRYRSPDGNEVGAWAYKSSLQQYAKTGVAPQSPVGNAWKRFQYPSAHKTHANTETFEELVTEIPIGDDGESISLELPEPKPSPTKHRTGLFNAKEISQGLATMLVIFTSLMAMTIKIPEAQMTEQEIRAISIPLANIIERSKYNRTIGALIVDRSDYMTLGYALYIYIDRVANAARIRRNDDRPTETAVPVTGQLNGTGTNGASGVPLRATQSGLRNIINGL